MFSIILKVLFRCNFDRWSTLLVDNISENTTKHSWSIHQNPSLQNNGPIETPWQQHPFRILFSIPHKYCFRSGDHPNIEQSFLVPFKVMNQKPWSLWSVCFYPTLHRQSLIIIIFSSWISRAYWSQNLLIMQRDSAKCSLFYTNLKQAKYQYSNSKIDLSSSNTNKVYQIGGLDIKDASQNSRVKVHSFKLI